MHIAVRGWQYGLVVLVVALVFVSGQGRSEYVFLKDGKIIEGAILNENARSVTLRTKEQKRETYSRDTIMRILYTRLYMGKVYVQKTDGRGVACYMVDEDQETYTFREDIASPREFTLRRDQVLFIARRNPSGLEGTAGTDRIHLKWLPPYNQVREYHVYLKGPNDAEYRKGGATGSKSYTVTGLSSNTEFRLYVTAVAREGDESLPSNEITLATKNIRPNPPGELTVEKGAPGTDGKITATLRWQAAADPDGRITGYTVYRHTEQGKKQVAKVTSREYTVRGIAPAVRTRFEVASTDDRGDESEEASDITVGTSGTGFFTGISANYIIPLGKFSDRLKPGYGGTVTIGYAGLFFNGFDVGVTAGCWYFEGNYRDLESSMIMPALATVRWRIELIEGFSIAPMAQGGYGYHRLTSKKRNSSTFALDTVTDTSFEPMALGGLDLVWQPWEPVMLHAGASYGAVFEEDGALPLVEIHLGAAFVW